MGMYEYIYMCVCVCIQISKKIPGSLKFNKILEKNEEQKNRYKKISKQINV